MATKRGVTLRRTWLLPAALVIAVPLSATRGEMEGSKGLSFGLVEAIAKEIRTGPLGQGGVFFGDVLTATDAQSVLGALGLTVKDLWWVPDADGNGAIEAADAALILSRIGGYAEGATADKVARAFLASGLGGTEVGGVVLQPGEEAAATSHQASISKSWPYGHTQAFSLSEWPPNHHGDYSRNWSHKQDISKTWPGNHQYIYSKDWPPVHQTTISPNVPPNHIEAVSKEWPIESHKQDVSRLWPPGHTKAKSAEWPKDHTTQKSLQDTPSPHHQVYSDSWPGDHDKTRSEQVWPPNHNGQISLTWNDHDLSVSKANWPPNHRSDISKTWRDGDSWPPNHHVEVSKTWTTPGTATPTPGTATPGTVGN